jgi:hypothetical protein
MTAIKLPYGTDFLEVNISEERLNGVLVSELHHYKPQLSQEELVRCYLRCHTFYRNLST